MRRSSCQKGVGLHVLSMLQHDAMEVQAEIEAVRQDLCELRKLLRQQEKLHQSEMQMLRREVEQNPSNSETRERAAASSS